MHYLLGPLSEINPSNSMAIASMIQLGYSLLIIQSIEIEIEIEIDLPSD